MTQMDKSATPKVVREVFGHLPDGTAIEMVRLRGDNGFEVRLITYGAALQSLLRVRIAPGASPTSCSATMILRAISRFGASSAPPSDATPTGSPTAASSWTAAGFNCPPTMAPMRCMAGWTASIASHWTVTAVGENPAPFVTLSYLSPDGEEGYPGTLKTEITYRISGASELSLAFSAVTDKPTIVNLTNHSFFNLAGVEAGGDILDHRLTIAADTYLPVSAAGIPLGRARARSMATPFDFRNPHRVGARLARRI